MSKINLITTSIIKQYQKNKKNFLLGDWCEDGKLEKNIMFNKTNYHWDNYQSRKKDLIYLMNFNDEILTYLRKQLNNFFKTNYPRRFWEIILMPWIWIYTSSLLDRWRIISTLDEKEKFFFNYQPYNKKTFAMNDLMNFKRSISQSFWTEFIFGEVIKFKKQFKIKILNKTINNKVNIQKEKKRENSYKKKFLYRNNLSKLNKNNIFIRSLYLTKMEKLKLYILNGNFLPFYEKFNYLNEFNYDEKKRDKVFSFEAKKKNFKNFAHSLIKYTLPKCYFEGFQDTILKTSKLNWPNCPKYILTSNAYDTDEIFKFYTALKVARKSKFIIFQHGGNLGTSEFHQGEKVQRNLADRYFTWGWKENKKDIPYSLSTMNMKKITKISSHKGLLIPIVEIHRFPAKIESSPRMRRDAKIYVKNIINFFSLIPNKIRDHSRIKYFSPFKKINIEDNTFTIDSIKKKYKKNIIYSNKNTLELAKNFSINVEFINSTGFYESIYANIPTILILDKKISKIRKKANTEFKILNKNNIFFYDPKDAANFIIKNYYKIDSWWYSIKTQDALNQFRKKFARHSHNRIDLLNELINDKIF